MIQKPQTVKVVSFYQFQVFMHLSNNTPIIKHKMDAYESKKISKKDAILHKKCPNQLLYISKKDVSFRANQKKQEE